jgi:hypothetical protein
MAKKTVMNSRLVNFQVKVKFRGMLLKNPFRQGRDGLGLSFLNDLFLPSRCGFGGSGRRSFRSGGWCGFGSGRSSSWCGGFFLF